LRPYQAVLVGHIERAWGQDSLKVLLQLPTGAGKTVVALGIMQRALSQKLKVGFFVNKTILCDQAYTSFCRYLDASKIGFIKAGRKASAAEHPVTIASIQTFSIRDTKPGFDVIILDEAHHCVAPSYLELLAQYPAAKILGLTATPYRLNPEESLGNVFDCKVDGPSISYLVSHKYLVQPIVLGPFDGATLITSKDMTQDSSRLKSIIKRWKFWAKSLNRSLKTIAFMVNIDHAHFFKALLDFEGVKSDILTGNTSAEERVELIARLESGKISILISVLVLGEGFDCPRANCLLLLRPTDSKALYVQQLGRGLRPFLDKEFCLVFDECGASFSFGLVLDIGVSSCQGSNKNGQVFRCQGKACFKRALINKSGGQCWLCARHACQESIEDTEKSVFELLAAKEKSETSRIVKKLNGLLGLDVSIDILETCEVSVKRLVNLKRDENVHEDVRIAAKEIGKKWRELFAEQQNCAVA